MHQVIEGAGLAPPAARYAHAVLSTGTTRMLHTSGVVPVAPDGTVPPTIGAQADVVWDAIAVMLAEADMTATDIVSVTTYVVADQAEGLGDVMAARDRRLDGHLAASTLVTVPRLVHPDWLVEVAVVATS